ncbi:MAG: glycosyltransferase family 4 protein [bacterium]|nr:glycosyltransferase family 4 protein [bacterium]
MKTALVWNHRSRLLDCSFRFEQYLSGLRALGHEPVVVCDLASADGFDGPLHTVDDPAVLEDPETWRSVGAEVALIVTWHRMSAVLQAMRAAGTSVISIADTDGRVGLRVFPFPTLERMLVYQHGAVARLRCLKYWLGRYLGESLAGSAEEREFLASTRSSDVLVLGHTEARRHFRSFLRRQGEERLDERVVVAPFTIGDAFLSCGVPEAKDDRIVAIGRWSDPQKDAGLLAAALDRFFERGAGTEVVILGEGGAERFEPLARRHEQVRVLGVQPQEVVARTLSASRAIIFSSRWEGSPHAATEALALGATVVGTPIPSLVSWSENGRFGTVSRSRRPGALARALSLEMAAWDAGERDPLEISRHWRALLEPREVCRKMLAAISD